MTTFLITGGIGAGKSTVRSILEMRKFDVYDCDSRCKALYHSVPGLMSAVERNVGLPFSRLSEVFSDPQALCRLEDTVYPCLLADIAGWKDSLHAGVCFIESAIALSRPCFSGVFDRVLVVSAPLALRSCRNADAGLRSQFQDPDIESKADYLIVNDSTLDELEHKVEDFLKYIQK